MTLAFGLGCTSIRPCSHLTSTFAFLPTANEVWGKIICLQVCVSPQRRGVPGPGVGVSGRGGVCLLPAGGLGPRGACYGGSGLGGCLVERCLVLGGCLVLVGVPSPRGRGVCSRGVWSRGCLVETRRICICIFL